MGNSTDIGRLGEAWEAMSARGDLSVLAAMLAPEAKWRGVEDGPGCENRQMILAIMERNLSDGLAGRIEETIKVGGRILVAFRPARPRDDGRPLDQGLAYVVVTMLDGQVIEMKGCVDRAAALRYARSGGSV